MSDEHIPTNAAFRSSVPFRPRRSSTTPSQRPRTSSGEIEPRSGFLRDALREKKGLPTRSQSTTPRRARIGSRPTTQQSPHDEWMPSSDEEKNILRASTSRPQKTRRASDIGSMRSSRSPNAMLGQKETGNKLDKLEKDNFDLKLKITMQQERMSQLHEELEQAVSNAHDLNNAVELLSKSIASTEEELERTRTSNQEIAEMNDELVKELEQRDEGIQLRQLAIEEAAGIIQILEIKCEKLEHEASRPDASPRTGSDYFSGDAEGTSPRRGVSLKVPLHAVHLGVLPTPPDSDYFSADTSPNNTPRTPYFTATEKVVQMIRAQEKGAQFNKELGLRSAASKDSLFSSFIDTPSQPPMPNRLLRRKTPVQMAQPRAKVPLQRAMTTMEASRQETPPWTSDSRQLRTLFAQGEFNRRIHASTPLRHTNTTPSVTVGSASNSDEDLLSTSKSQLSRSTPAVSDPTMTPSQKLHQARNYAPMQQQQSQEPHFIPSRTPVNYNNWPRKYPEWPPSLGLRDRDILFHGDGMAEVFPASASQVAMTQPHSTISHLRSSSTTPADALGLSPATMQGGSGSVGITTTPQSAPPVLVKKTFSHRLSSSFNGGRPVELERRKTTLR